ncbi:hypothetical protein KIN20_002769 [Parelaphostrongylus tenuis]|uniref:Uncharacterized protein n=1 Tax=Parelaphostrongylus tenuis TaxID=148309 RepID=A0AAD5QFL2_PARTN|nr:hypothetical protein KIN20_002769 [Parelaphostrongylus tenuis]
MVVEFFEGGDLLSHFEKRGSKPYSEKIPDTPLTKIMKLSSTYSLRSANKRLEMDNFDKKAYLVAEQYPLTWKRMTLRKYGTVSALYEVIGSAILRTGLSKVLFSFHISCRAKSLMNGS